MAGEDTLRSPEEESLEPEGLGRVDTKKPEFSVDDLLRSLQREVTGDGWTIRELCEKMDVPYTTRFANQIRRKIHDLREVGVWEVAGVKRFTDDGRAYTVRVYRPKGGMSEEEIAKACEML